MRSLLSLCFTSLIILIVGNTLFGSALATLEEKKVVVENGEAVGASSERKSLDPFDEDGKNQEQTLAPAGIIGNLSEPVTMLLIGVALIQLGRFGRRVLRAKYQNS